MNSPQESTPASNSSSSQSNDTLEAFDEATEDASGSLHRNLGYLKLFDSLEPDDYASYFKLQAEKQKKLVAQGKSSSSMSPQEGNNSFFSRSGYNAIYDTNKWAQSNLEEESESKIMSSSDSLLEINEPSYLRDLRIRHLEASLEYYKALSGELLQQNQKLMERIQALEEEKRSQSYTSTSLEK